MRSHFRNFDWLLSAAVLILCAVGWLILFSVDMGGQGSGFALKQGVFIGLGLVLMLAVSFLDIRILKNHSSVLAIFYLVSVALLVALLIFGSKTRGTMGWFKFGGINFEPAELVKLIIVLVLAKYFSARHVEVFRARHIVISALYVLIPCFLVLRQPDMGSAIIFLIIWLGVVLLAGIKWRHLVIVFLGGALLAALAWGLILKPYQKGRVLTFLNPNKDPQGQSYNLIQSKIAIGSGGWWGKGLGQGSQGQLGFLPEKHTDFIFAVLAEEWGFLGVLFLIGIYAVFFWRLMKISLASHNNFFRLLAAGFALMVFAQTAVNIGMNLGLLPIAGLSLPFISYGGSNLLVNFLALGLIQNIAVQNNKQYEEVEE